MKRSRHTGCSRPDGKSVSLRLEDRMLWETVTRDVRPLFARRQPLSEPEAAPARPGPPVKAGVAGAPSVPQTARAARENQGHKLHGFDSAVHRKIARGRMHIEARVDLHGLTQQQAYTLLLHFLQSAQHRGLRHIMVITGKGASQGSDGILRQAVPHWLETAPFRFYIHGFEWAARQHGGPGALYIRLRRLPPGRI